ncbi:hypothetical protein [Fusobacterium animalis]|uniref:hypothetical protein n=1 Tax=Fusobacterium animalis TaxID=76859 RepID=UPI0035642249
MKIFLWSFLGSFSGIITAFIVLNFFIKLKDLIFSDKALDYKIFKNFLEKEMKNHRCHKFKVTPWTKIETYKIELDKIIDGFIKESRKTSDYFENKLLQKLCIDLSYLKTVLKDEEKEEIVREIILNENLKYDFNNEIHYFLKLVNKYTDRVREYTKNKLENDFNKIKINEFDNFVVNLNNEIKNNKETINLDRNKKITENIMYLKDILTDNEKIAARDEIVNKYDFRNRGYFFIKLIDENFERIVKYKNEKLNN